jgi:hypothetical protein
MTSVQWSLTWIYFIVFYIIFSSLILGLLTFDWPFEGHQVVTWFPIQGRRLCDEFFFWERVRD